MIEIQLTRFIGGDGVAAGPVLFPDGTVAAPSVAFATDPDTGMFRTSTNTISFAAGGANSAFMSGSAFYIYGNSFYLGNGNVLLSSDAANILALKNADVAQEFRVYGATTGTKCIELAHNGTTGTLNTTSGALELNGATGVVNMNGNFLMVGAKNITWNTDAGGGLGGAATRPGYVNIGGRTVTVNTQPALNISEVWNEASTIFTGMKFNVSTDTASSASSLLMDLQVGGVSKFRVDKVGAIVLGGNVGLGAVNAIGFVGRSYINSPTDGSLNLVTSLFTGFNTLNLGPTTGNTLNGTLQIDKVTTVINMATATGTGTGTITSPTTALPAGTLIKGISCRVSQALAGLLLTTFSVGDGVDADKWGAGIAKDLNTLVNIGNYTITGPTYQIAAGSIVLTAAAGVFSTGILTCTTYFERFIPIGS